MERLEEGEQRTQLERLDARVAQGRDQRTTFGNQGSSMSDLGNGLNGFGSSNPGGAANSSVTTERVLAEAFEFIKVTYKTLASQVGNQ